MQIKSNWLGYKNRESCNKMLMAKTKMQMKSSSNYAFMKLNKFMNNNMLTEMSRDLWKNVFLFPAEDRRALSQ